MKTSLSILACLIVCLTGVCACPSQDEVVAAIDQIKRHVVSNDARQAAKVVFDFAEQSDKVAIKINVDAIPWLKEKWGLESDLERSIHSILLAAYIAGNIKSQLDQQKPNDDPYAGWTFVFSAYNEFRSKVDFSSPSIELLKRKLKDNTLRDYAREVLKKEG